MKFFHINFLSINFTLDGGSILFLSRLNKVLSDILPLNFQYHLKFCILSMTKKINTTKKYKNAYFQWIKLLKSIRFFAEMDSSSKTHIVIYRNLKWLKNHIKNLNIVALITKNHQLLKTIKKEYCLWIHNSMQNITKNLCGIFW